MILVILFVPLTALIFSHLLWSDCVSFFLDSAFFLCFLLVIQPFCILFILFLTSFAKDSSVMLSDFPDLLSSSSSSSSLSVVEKTSKRLLQFILDVSVLFRFLRGPFRTVLNVSSTSNTFFWLQTDLLKCY